MIRRNHRIFWAGLVAALSLLPLTAVAQVVTGNVTGRVVDPSGAVIVGANVVLISEVHGNRLAPEKTNKEGIYTFADITADTYTIEVTAPAFKTTRETGVEVTAGDHVGVPPITLQVGATTESISVTAEATLVQTQSGERSYAIEQVQVEQLPIGHSNFANLVAFSPGTNGTTRLGSPTAENNFMMDGVSAMDTGNNGQMLSLNIESIGEIKVITQGYQAEFGRATGLQISSSTKSGSNSLHGSFYGLFTNSTWNSRSWTNQKNGTPQAYSYNTTWGASLGGPVVIPKIFNGRNKLFFFIAEEWRPSTSVVNAPGSYLRLPTALEIAGNFSQSLNNQGALIAPIVDNQSGKPFPGSIIPQSRMYAPGLAVLNQVPVANLTQQPGTSYNYAETPGSVNKLETQPVIKGDYVLNSKIRFSGKYAGDIQRVVTTPGSVVGYNDSSSGPYPWIENYTATMDWTVTPSTVLEFTWGSIKNQLTGGGIFTTPASNRLTTLSAFPELYPNWGVLNTSYYAYQTASANKFPFFDGKQFLYPPNWNWGGLISNGIPSLGEPGYLNINHTNDYAVSGTKIWGQHTIKAGAYLNHSYKAQNTGAGGLGASPQGNVSFANDTNNPLDSGFGYANAELGVFDQYLQQSKYVEGNFVYYNLEFYLQDNWKVNRRLTLDYGMRFTHETPQYDALNQMSNFFPTTGALFGGGPNAYNPAQAQVLYVGGCANGATTCSGNNYDAKNPITGAVITAGGANTQVLIGTPVPGVGNPLDGIVQAGTNGTPNTNTRWAGLVFGPRIGAAYDLTGKGTFVIRGGAGLFYERPDGNTVFSTPGNPPIATAQNLYYGQLQSVGQGGLSPQPVPGMVTYQYNAKIPSTWQWQVGVQKSLPGQMLLDFSYVGNHAYNQLGATQGGNTQSLNQIPFGTAYLPQNQNPTLAPSTVPGADAYSTNLLRPYPGLGSIGQNTPIFHSTYHSLQLTVNRRFSHGFALGANYTRGISLRGNNGLTQRYQLQGGVLVLWSGEAAYEALNSFQDPTPNFLKLNTTWNAPGYKPAGNGFFDHVAHVVTSDWQISGVLSAYSGGSYLPNYSYQSNGNSVNITGSPDFGGGVVIGNNLGSGCSGNQFSQFNAAAITGPTYGSTDMESGRNNDIRGCPVAQVDTAIVRRFHFWKFKESKTFQFRTDIFNALNAAMITSRSTTATFNNPTSMTLENPEFSSTGSILAGKQLPQNAGFGAATNALGSRNIQFEIRIGF